MQLLTLLKSMILYLLWVYNLTRLTSFHRTRANKPQSPIVLYKGFRRWIPRSNLLIGTHEVKSVLGLFLVITSSHHGSYVTPMCICIMRGDQTIRNSHGKMIQPNKMLTTIESVCHLHFPWTIEMVQY